MSRLKKIVVIGPESTGKSTLCEMLAKHYNTVWCPEYAREYLLKNGISYTYQDLLTIAKGQVGLETVMVNGRWPMVNKGELMGSSQLETGNRKLETSNLQPATVFIDTDLYVMKVWCEYVFNKCHNYILEEIAARQYDLYLLCNIDLPWEDDPMREYPDEKARLELFRIFKDILVNQNTPWVTISGQYGDRLQAAVAAVDKLLTI